MDLLLWKILVTLVNFSYGNYVVHFQTGGFAITDWLLLCTRLRNPSRSCLVCREFNSSCLIIKEKSAIIVSGSYPILPWLRCSHAGKPFVIWLTRFGPKVAQIGHKLDKSGTFFRSDSKKSQIHLPLFWPKSDHPGSYWEWLLSAHLHLLPASRLVGNRCFAP